LRNKFRILQLLTLLFLLSGAFSSAWAQKRIQFAELLVGTGIVNEQISPDHVYRPFLLCSRYSVSVLKKERKNHLLLFYAEPQINLIAISPTKQSRAVENNNNSTTTFAWEAGLNMGFEYRYYFKNYFCLLGFGSGPHFISATVAKQANGFIFSDNFYGGFGKVFNDKFSAFTKVNFRHISNAGLKEPNYGIDNVLIFLGTSIKL
jgi:hypothetical protein